jgi:glycolate oxidase iron-sulfur subunit
VTSVGSVSSSEGLSVLGIQPDDLAACVSCGLCLAHCPTFRVSGEERLSPRGRITAMRAAEAGAPIDDAFEEIMQTCVQCRACETACPSSVPFGRMMEATRAATARRSVPWWQRAGYSVLGHHRLLLALSAAGGLAQRAGLVPRRLADRLSLPRLPVKQAPLVASGEDVWLFTGCVMDAWQRSVHRDAMAVLEACGFGVALPSAGASCCGALHVHAGLHDGAARLARKVMEAFPGQSPILVDSAGCGAVLKDYGHLLGTDEAARFASRVRDIHEWLADSADRLPAPAPGWNRPRVAVQDPCHLRHVQHVVQPVRTVLSPYADLVELPDEGRCCGAGGAYSALQPSLARPIRSQKVAVIDSVSADLVASANPGCSMWLAGAGVRVRHPVEIVALAAGLRPEED